VNRLGPVQRMVLQELEWAVFMSAVEVGRSIHRRRHGEQHLERFPDGEPCCAWCVDDARDVLATLEERGLVERHGMQWVRSEAPATWLP
jgi:ribosomal protein S19E (S16A)